MNLRQLLREQSRCADCGRYVTIDAYDGDAYYWTGEHVYVCERCNEKRYDKSLEDDREWPQADNE